MHSLLYRYYLIVKLLVTGYTFFLGAETVVCPLLLHSTSDSELFFASLFSVTILKSS